MVPHRFVRTVGRGLCRIPGQRTARLRRGEAASAGVGRIGMGRRGRSSKSLPKRSGFSTRRVGTERESRRPRRHRTTWRMCRSSEKEKSLLLCQYVRYSAHIHAGSQYTKRCGTLVCESDSQAMARRRRIAFATTQPLYSRKLPGLRSGRGASKLCPLCSSRWAACIDIRARGRSSENREGY